MFINDISKACNMFFISKIGIRPILICTDPLSLLIIDARGYVQIHRNENTNNNNNISHSIHSFWYRREIAFISLNKNGYSCIFYNGKNSCTFIPFILDISGEKANNSGNTISFM